jgi:hypothetical protein
MAQILEGDNFPGMFHFFDNPRQELAGRQLFPGPWVEETGPPAAAMTRYHVC